MATPTPQTWTLRLKARKTTVLLHIDPLHNFTTIKTALYTALSETSLKDPETGVSIPLPSSPSDIQLGRPVNPNDPNEGFQLGEWEYTDDGEEDDGGKGKGKAKKASTGDKAAAPANVKDCPKGAGLKDGAVLAFRWVGEDMWDGDEEEDGTEGNMWGVKLASFEDAYGVENEMDLGGRKEFEG